MLNLQLNSEHDKSDGPLWQNETRRCAVVLEAVFSWLSGEELACVGATCRAWRRAADEPSLWRVLLVRDGVPPALLQRLSSDIGAGSWRQEYVSGRAGWSPVTQHVVAAGGASLLHGALAPTAADDTLALAADDASLAVWRCERGMWAERWRTELQPRGWSSVARVAWARAQPRLLLAGPRALVDDWELMVLQLDEDYGEGCVLSRVRCSAGAAGCWVDGGDAFLSLELALLAPGIACTTVWLNSATQETQSEYAGVMTPLLRIFNEDGAHITHALVAEAEERRTLVLGSARGLGSWPVAQPRPAALVAGAPGELAARVLRRRELRARPDPEAPLPDEHSVRAACAPPDRELLLPAPLIGLVLHDSGLWVMAVCSDGSVTRACTRTLTALSAWAARAPLPHAAALGPQHYVQPAVSSLYAASPAGGYSPRVWTWSVRSGVRSEVGGGKRRGPAVCALLPRGGPHRHALLTFAADTLYVWRSRATRQSRGGQRPEPGVHEDL